jgi:serine/threonine protein kinase, bacterial
LDNLLAVGHLLDTTETATEPVELVRHCGDVVQEFDHRSQDSGNVSWLVQTPGSRYFVKTAGRPGPPPEGAPTPYFDHAGRVALLRNAVAVAESCDHPALPRLLNVIESPLGPALVYEAVDGELVGTARASRADPTTAYQRFARLPADDLLRVFDSLIDLHASLAQHGWVAVDLYDGCLIVDFSTGALKVVDLDSYRRGPTPNDMGRMFGATRFMAPEEFSLGAPIDQRTTVFTLGRLVHHFGTRLSEELDEFCGPSRLASIVGRATSPDRDDRYADVAEFAGEWVRARTPR